MSDVVLPGGFKRWFVVAANEEHCASNRIDSERNFLRMEPCVSFDTFELATWFRSRGQAIEHIDAENLDIKKLQLVEVRMSGMSLMRLLASWSG